MNKANRKVEIISLNRRLSRFLLGISLIIFFIFGLCPLLANAPYIRPMLQLIEEYEIDAAALYYTEIEEFSEAAINIRNTMKYTPQEP